MQVNKDINILIVDDNMGIRMVAKKMFQKLGYMNLTLADDGSTALEKLKAENFDLVVADWQMPEMSGLDLVKEMRNDDNLKDIPFLLATGDDDQKNLFIAIKAGISNFMNKPYEVAIIEQKIEKIFAFHEKKKNRKP